jgi:two-component SAPR family response regulator
VSPYTIYQNMQHYTIQRKYRCIIINKDPQISGQISNYLKQLSNMEVVGIFSNAYDAFKFGKNEPPVDFLFLSIDQQHGYEMGVVQKWRNRVKFFIIISDDDKHALSTRHSDTDEFLLKPLYFRKFCSVIWQLLERDDRNSKFRYIANQNGKWHRLFTSND